jgi:hypothetical protein
VLHGFFSADPEAVAAALRALADGASHGEVTRDELPRRVDGAPGPRPLRLERGGLFCEKVFGPQVEDRCLCQALAGPEHRDQVCARCGVVCGSPALRQMRFGHLPAAGLVHPAAFAGLGSALGITPVQVEDLAQGTLALRAGEVITSEEFEEDEGDLIGPDGVAAALEQRHPGHPLLPLTRITQVPVPPPGDRPLWEGLSETQLDPWAGPLNEAWQDLLLRTRRQLRLLELSAPGIILRHEAGMTERAFLRVLRLTLSPPARPSVLAVPERRPLGGLLVPPLRRAPAGVEDSEALALAFLGEDQLLLQRRTGVWILGLDGSVLLTLPPAPCRLRGVAQGRYAVFHQMFHGLYFNDPEAAGLGPEHERAAAERIGHWAEVSVVDTVAGRYLEAAVAGLPRALIGNDEPEDLFVHDLGGERRIPLRVGGDRPTLLAYTQDLRFAWIAGEVEQVVEVETAIPQCSPPGGARLEQALDLRKGTLKRLRPRPDREADANDDDEADDGEEPLALAVAFADQHWHFLIGNRLRNETTLGVTRLSPRPAAAAFSASGERLALVVGREIVVVARRSLEVLGRLPLPAQKRGKRSRPAAS